MSDATSSTAPEGAPDSSFPSIEELAVLLPHLEFERLIGTGGMGAVYLARQPEKNRWVAVKVLPRSASDNEEDSERFITEATSMAKLHHSHIAAVYEFGHTPADHLYLVMEYVKGHDLHYHIHQDTLTLPVIRSLVHQLCEALQYAHENSVIHRDIKPANILITEDWQAKIVDFGLASEHAVIVTDHEYGTPEYIAPERLEPGSIVDHRADIYALGVVMHEMFTRKTPLAAGSSAMTNMPDAYATVIARCMAPDPAKRFQTAADIRTFLATAEAVRQKKKPLAPPTVPALPRTDEGEDELENKATRVEAVRWLWAAAAFVLVAGGWWWVEKQQENDRLAAAEAARQARAAEEAARATELEAEEAKAKSAEPLKTTNPAKKEEVTPKVADELPPLPVEPPFRPEASPFAVIRRLKGHSAPTHSVHIQPDQGRVVSFSEDKTIRLWNAATGKEVRRHASPLGALSQGWPSVDGKQALIDDTQNDEVALMDLNTGKLLQRTRLANDGFVRSVWAPKGPDVFLLTITPKAGVFTWDPSRLIAPALMTSWQRAAYSLAFLPGDRIVITGASLKPGGKSDSANPDFNAGNPEGAVFAMKHLRRLHDLPNYQAHMHTLTVSPSGKLLAGIQRDQLTLYDAATLTPVSIKTSTEGLRSIAWTQNGRFLLLGHADGRVRFYDAWSDSELSVIETGIQLMSLSISKDQTWAVGAGSTSKGASQTKDGTDHDLLIFRLPDVSNLPAAQPPAAAPASLSDILKVDPEIAKLYSETVMSSQGALVNDERVISAILELTIKFGQALKRAAATASPPAVQLAMNQEADAIARRAPVPPATTDSATVGEHRRLRGIYRQQLSQLEAKRQQDIAQLRQNLGPTIKELAAKRGNDPAGAARCEAFLDAISRLNLFETVLTEAFRTARQK